jgi:hypothetical protein
MNTSPVALQARTLRIIFYAIVAGQVMFAVVAYILHVSDAFIHTMAGETIPVIIACAAAGSAVMAAKALLMVRLRAIGETGGIVERIRQYFVANIVFLALLEAATIILVVMFMLNGNILLLLLVPVVLAVAAMHYPSDERIERDIHIPFQ